MPKFWLLLIVVFFLIRYVLPVVLRAVLGGFVRKQMRDSGFAPPPQAARSGPPPAPGQVRVDFVPPAPKAPGPDQPHDFKGGEYVDFEEVK